MSVKTMRRMDRLFCVIEAVFTHPLFIFIHRLLFCPRMLYFAQRRLVGEFSKGRKQCRILAKS